MNIRNLIMSAIVTAMTLVTATCFAQISTDDLLIGGLYPGQPWSEVVDMYGQPSWTQVQPTKEMAYIYDSIKGGQVLLQKENERVTFIAITSNKLMSTVRGICLGATKAEVLNSYGMPDKEIDDSTGHLSLTYLTGKENESLRFTIYQDRVKWMYSSGSIHSAKPSSRPSSQAQTRPTSTIPKSVQEMPESEFYIGGITIGQTFDYVEQIYGKPGKIDDEGFFQIYNYNDRFIVKGKLNNGYKVCSVAIYEKGLTTPSGFTGEMPYEAVTKKYGVGHETKFKAEGVEAKLKGCKDYTYFCNNKQMVFLVDKKGVIKAVRVEERDDQKFIEAKRKK